MSTSNGKILEVTGLMFWILLIPTIFTYIARFETTLIQIIVFISFLGIELCVLKLYEDIKSRIN